MPKTHIEKAITIAAGIERVKSIITDFNHWKHWSPWLILDPEAKVTVSADAKTQEWEGTRIGSGKMMVVRENNLEIKYDLIFLKPFKSKAKADFLMEMAGNNSTTLTWTIDGSLPFFMFFMKNMMERLIGMDYERGLLMLKDYIEKGSVGSKLEFLPESYYSGCNYVGINKECTIDEVGALMASDFKKLMGFAQENDEIITDELFTIYHKYDLNKNKVVYTSGVGVKTAQQNLPSGLFNGNVRATKIRTVRHIGPYELLGNAWSAVMAMDRSGEFKKNKKIPPMEFYRNSPGDTVPKELISDVCMPVK